MLKETAINVQLINSFEMEGVNASMDTSKKTMVVFLNVRITNIWLMDFVEFVH